MGRMLVNLSLLALVLASTACTKSNPISCVDEYCQDPSLPFCDVDGALEGTPQTCIAVDCTPGDVAGCRGDSALVCNAGGNNYDISHCDHGCDPVEGCKSVSCVPNTVKCGDRVVETCSAAGELTTQACDVACVDGPAPHCAYIAPRYLPNICDAAAAQASKVVATSQTVDTTDDSLCNGGIVSQSPVADICVVRYGSFRIEPGATWRVVGSRVLAVVTDGQLRVGGVLDVSSGVTGSGPAASTGSNPNGGGGGFATNGGDRGGVADSGGIAFDPRPLAYLRGGSGGGGRLGFCGGGALGGGATTLISCRNEVTVDGALYAGGAGGGGGYLPSQGGTCSGGGGGAGGYVVLQGLDVRVSGNVFANGGGGGCGKSATANGLPGPDGKNGVGLAATCMPTGGESVGGAGGSAGSPPGNGVGSFGGGGGSMGFFQTYTPNGVVPTLTPAAASPGFSPNDNVPTR